MALVVTMIVDEHHAGGRHAVRPVSEDEQLAAERVGQHIGPQGDLGGTARSHRPIEHQHLVGGPRLVEVVGGEHHRGTGRPLLDDQRGDALLSGRVESGDRFVEQQQPRLGSERLGDADTLLLTSRQLAERPAAQLDDVGTLDRRVDRVVVGATEAADEPSATVATHADHLVHGERDPAVLVVLLGDERRARRERVVDRAGSGIDERGQGVEEGGLAAAVGTDERRDAGRHQFERGPIEGDRRPVAHDEVVDADRGHWIILAGSELALDDRKSIVSGMVLSRFSLSGATVALAATLLTACGDNGDAGTGADGAVSMVATTSVWADVLDAVTCRGAAGVEVTGLIPPQADPHGYEASLQDRQTLDDAALVVANGLGLEARFADLLEIVDDAKLVQMTDLPGVTIHAAADGHDHDEGDPHIWLDPHLVASLVEPLASRIVAIDGVDGQAVARCADEYVTELEALDTDIADLTARLPVERRILVTNHDAYGYFAERYGFEIVGTVIPSTSTMAQTNAADLAELADTIEEHRVPAIFVDVGHSAADADSLAGSIGVDVVPLDTESVGGDDSAGTYVAMMRANAAAIVDALGGGRTG